MAPRKPKPKGSPKVPSKPTKVTKPKSAARSVKQPAAYRVKRYRNGLVNLEKTPAHLVAIVKANAMSPLLRLPPEIRNRIWSFACGGQLVVLPGRRKRNGGRIPEKGGAVCFDNDKYRELPLTIHGFSILFIRYDPPTKIVSAFHLPEVCRQIYSETALTSYRENTFLYDTSIIKRSDYVSRLMVAQKRAITNLELDPYVLKSLLSSKSDGASTNITDVLPNVRSFSITPSAMEHVRRQAEFYGREPIKNGNLEQWRAWATEQLEEWKDRGVELVFED